MRKKFYMTLLCALVTGGLIGCSSSDRAGEATTPSDQSNAASVAPATNGIQLQYRSVCIEKEAHGGNEYVLSKWLDDRDKANSFGQYHGDFKEKGHRWRVEERVKPEQKKP